MVNHLGIADFRITAGGREYRLALEITSAKLEYHTEFRQITEDIADFCQQLLLNWDGPTSLKFTNDPEEAARLTLEKFLFLRSHLPPERLEELLDRMYSIPDCFLRDALPRGVEGGFAVFRVARDRAAIERFCVSVVPPRNAVFVDFSKSDWPHSAWFLSGGFPNAGRT